MLAFYDQSHQFRIIICSKEDIDRSSSSLSWKTKGFRSNETTCIVYFTQLKASIPPQIFCDVFTSVV